jgi:GGDEF domain-containing protein
MISIKRFLDSAKNDAASALVRTGMLLLEAIAVHAVNYDPAACAAFGVTIRRLRRNIEESSDGDRVLVLCGEVIHTLEQYNRGVETGIRTQSADFQEMLRMLARTVVEVSSAGATAAANLNQIERQLDNASRMGDLRQLKTQLGEALKALAEESMRQRDRAERISHGLKTHLDSAMQSGQRQFDPVTGLPGVEEATESLASQMSSPNPGYAALFRVERLELINSRFGFGAGDRVLVILSQHVAQQLSSTDRLYRWRGPALLALLQRSARAQDVRLEVTRISSTRLEHVIEIRNRSVLLPISSTSLTLRLAESASAGDAVETLNSFSEWEPQAAGKR